MNTQSEKKTRWKNKSNSKQLRILIAKICSHYKSVENHSVHFVETIHTIQDKKFHFELWTISNYKNSLRHLFLKKNSSSVRHFFPMTPLCPSAVCLLKRFQNVEVSTQIILCVCVSDFFSWKRNEHSFYSGSSIFMLSFQAKVWVFDSSGFFCVLTWFSIVTIGIVEFSWFSCTQRGWEASECDLIC